MLRDRQVLANEGVVVVIVSVNAESGELLNDPEIVTRGWVYAPEAEGLLEEAADAVRRAVADAHDHDAFDIESLQRTVRRAAGKFVSDKTKRRPMIVPVVLEA